MTTIEETKVMTIEEERVQKLIEAKAFKVNKYTQMLIDKHLEMERRYRGALADGLEIKDVLSLKAYVVRTMGFLREMEDHRHGRFHGSVWHGKRKAVKALDTLRLYKDLAVHMILELETAAPRVLPDCLASRLIYSDIIDCLLIVGDVYKIHTPGGTPKNPLDYYDENNTLTMGKALEKLGGVENRLIGMVKSIMFNSVRLSSEPDSSASE